MARFVMTSKVVIFLLVSFCCSELFSNGPFAAAAPTASTGTASNCQQTWLATPNRSLAGGSVNAAATTLAACQAACLASSTCQSIDFASAATAGKRCYLNNAQGTSRSNIGNTHYDLTRAPASCTCVQSWLQVNGLKLAGGSVNAAATTLAACQAACLTSSTCQSIDFTPAATAGKRCYLNTAKGTSGSSPGNSHYDLTRAASSSCTTTSKKPSTTPTFRSSTVVVPTTTSKRPTTTSQDCQATWKKTSQSTVFQSTSLLSSLEGINVELCKAACLTNPGCQSIDFFDPNVGESGFTHCYLYTGHGEPTSFANTDHYDLTRSCATPMSS